MEPTVRENYILFWNDRGELDAINNRTTGEIVPPEEWENLGIDLKPEAIALDLESVKIAVTEQVYEFARSYYELLTARYAPSEVATWARKQQEAVDYLNGSLSPGSNLETEAKERYPDVDLETAIANLAQSILAKADHLNFHANRIAGIRGRHSDAIAHLDSIEAVQAYDWRSGWT